MWSDLLPIPQRPGNPTCGSRPYVLRFGDPYLLLRRATPEENVEKLQYNDA